MSTFVQKKSQSFVIGNKLKRCKLTICNKSVDQVMAFVYLEINITSNKNLEEEVQAKSKQP
jgi:hypothetical protein